MSGTDLDALVGRGYQHGFVTEIESDTVAPGLDEDVVRLISRKKREPQFLLDWRLKALAHWRTLREPHWAQVRYPPIDYQDITYYAAPKSAAELRSEKVWIRVSRQPSSCGRSSQRRWSGSEPTQV